MFYDWIPDAERNLWFSFVAVYLRHSMQSISHRPSRLSVVEFILIPIWYDHYHSLDGDVKNKNYRININQWTTKKTLNAHNSYILFIENDYQRRFLSIIILTIGLFLQQMPIVSRRGKFICNFLVLILWWRHFCRHFRIFAEKKYTYDRFSLITAMRSRYDVQWINQGSSANVWHKVIL